MLVRFNNDNNDSDATIIANQENRFVQTKAIIIELISNFKDKLLLNYCELCLPNLCRILKKMEIFFYLAHQFNGKKKTKHGRLISILFIIITS